jgi:hypothetical protein
VVGAGVGLSGGAGEAGGGVDGVGADEGAERAESGGGPASAVVEVEVAAGVESGRSSGWRRWVRGL